MLIICTHTGGSKSVPDWWEKTFSDYCYALSSHMYIAQGLIYTCINTRAFVVIAIYCLLFL